MKRSFKIATKIGLSLSIMVIGYLVLTIMATKLGMDVKVNLENNYIIEIISVAQP